MNSLAKERFDKITQSLKPKKITLEKSYFEKLNLKYPNINFSENENLSIPLMIETRFKKIWFDVNKYPKIDDMIIATGYSKRSIYRIAKQLDLPNRSKKK